MVQYDAPVVFTPANEPYLGRSLLYHFDLIISDCMEKSNKVAQRSRQLVPSPAQKMASQVITQATSLALSIRELIRQGYLFGARVLERPLTERATILQYLELFPEHIPIWERGWRHGEAPSLAKMIEAIQKRESGSAKWKGGEITASLNSVIHGKPDSAWANLVEIEGVQGFAPSKILNRPDLCDEICASTTCWLIVVGCMMNAYFPSENGAEASSGEPPGTFEPCGHCESLDGLEEGSNVGESDQDEQLRKTVWDEMERISAALQQPSARAELVSRILRAHLLVENSLKLHLQTANPRLNVEGLGLNFDRLRRAVAELKEPSSGSMDGPIKALNRIRNLLAHHLDASIPREDSGVIAKFVIGESGSRSIEELIDDFGTTVGAFAILVGMILAMKRVLVYFRDDLQRKFELHKEAERILRELSNPE